MRIAALVGPEFEDSEFRIPYDRFRAAGHEVVVVGRTKGQVLEGHKRRESVEVEQGVDEARPDRFDALFVPGGHSPDYLRADKKVVDFVRSFRDKPVFAVCHGPQLLITADMVRGRTMTAWGTVQVDLRNAGAHVLDQEVVIDRNLVTSRKPGDLEAFAREALSLLRNGATARP